MQVLVREAAPREWAANARPTSVPGFLTLRAAVLATALVATLPAAAAAHGDAPAAPSVATLWEAWTFAPEVWLPVILAAAAYWFARRRVDQRHPTNPVPRWRMWAWMAGLAFRTTSLARAAAALRRGSIPFSERDGRLVVAAREAINAVIEFVE